MMTFQLADSSAGPATSVVPDQPTATTPTSVSGVTLQMYLAKRIAPNAVLVVFALVAPTGISQEGIYASLSANGGGVDATVSGVALLDPTGLKEYLPYMGDPSNDRTCVCSNLFNSSAGLTSGNTPTYFAAVLAAPPESVQTVSFVTGLGTIPNVTLSQ